MRMLMNARTLHQMPFKPLRACSLLKQAMSVQIVSALLLLSLLLMTPLTLVAAEKASNSADKEELVPAADISIVGTGGDLYKNLELHLPSRIPACTESTEDIKQFIKSLKRRFRGAARAVGYYDAVFTPTTRMINNCWTITINVSANRPVRVTQARFIIKGDGLQQQEFRELRNNPPYQNGDILNHKKYTDYKTSLKEIAQAFGYFDAAFEEHKISVNPINYSATIDLVLNTGRRFRYGKINVEQKVLNKKVIKTFLQIKEGDFYSSEDLIAQQQLLQSSGFYKDISIHALHKEAANQQIPIKISLQAKKRNAWKFKVGYGTDTGPRINGELNRRWTSAKGDGLSLTATAAPKVSTFVARLTEPKANPHKGVLSYFFEWKQDKDGDILGRSYKLGAEYTRKTSDDWKQKATLTYLLETTQEGNTIAGKSHLTLLGASVEKTEADNYLYPLNGWHIKAGAHGAIEKLLSDQSILQLEINSKLITELGEGRLIGRLDFGSTLVGDFDSLPKSLRFFAGGGRSVRGYGFNLLGETNSTNDVLGGKHLLVGSVEYEYRIDESWSAAAFLDAGNAFNDLKSPDLKLGAGFGVRWRSPVGPVRVDIGFPQDKFADPRLHISIGSDL
ncbi:MAG TPA: outer membrane protein assembly factor [Leucothrix mucor]|uniref:Translocation and assembly module subunit TamA n=1 Tax=Leucothrix mucor TaxID=45248 RepID=A0A7V2T215_LEUMU|nr:outer membrane protein assembly factor [Leucothrix mucor]